jgi:RimJ/RimL family protein N-acetyltransferase
MAPTPPTIPDRLETARLTVRCPRAGDGAALHRAIRESVEELRRWPESLGWAVGEQSVEISEQYCRAAHAAFVARQDFPLLLTLHETGSVIGSSGLHRPDWEARSFEIGWWGHTPSLGQGLITEGVAAVLAFAFEAFSAHRVEALPEERNERSCALCERVGMTWNGALGVTRLVAAAGTPAVTRIYAAVR